jgi:hypothetical protein
MVSSRMLHHVALVRTDVSEELNASFIRVTRIDELGTTLAVTSNLRALCNCSGTDIDSDITEQVPPTLGQQQIQSPKHSFALQYQVTDKVQEISSTSSPEPSRIGVLYLFDCDNLC